MPQVPAGGPVPLGDSRGCRGPGVRVREPSSLLSTVAAMRSLRTASVAPVAQLAAVWGVIFAVVHVYWAAGGAAGMNGDTADTLGAQSYIAFVAVLGLTGAAVAGSLAHGSRRRVLIRLARAGGVALLLGVVFGTGRWLADWSLDGDGATGVAITTYFLLGGVLFSLLGWRGASPLPHAERAAVR